MVDKVADDQSFISVGTDFSLRESCGVSASNYQNRSPTGILIIQRQTQLLIQMLTCLPERRLHVTCVS